MSSQIKLAQIYVKNIFLSKMIKPYLTDLGFYGLT